MLRNPVGGGWSDHTDFKKRMCARLPPKQEAVPGSNL